MTLKISEFRPWMLEARGKLLRNPEISHMLASIDLTPGLQSPDNTSGNLTETFDRLIEDAVSTLELIKSHAKPNQRLLEIGGGIALTNVWLQHLGIDITSIEPSDHGHSLYFDLGKKIIVELGHDPERWQPYFAHEVTRLSGHFDLVFSNNVLEHISNLDDSFAAIRSVLTPTGIMRHNCPNYFVPYEPHFGIPLLPFWQKSTEILMPALKKNGLWKSLNFITSARLRRLATFNNLSIDFDSGHLYNALERLETDPLFRAKHGHISSIYRVLKFFGFDLLIKRLPPSISTPMQVTIRQR